MRAEGFGGEHGGGDERAARGGGGAHEGEGDAGGIALGGEGEEFVGTPREIGGGAQEVERFVGTGDAQHAALAPAAVGDEGAGGTAEGGIGGHEGAGGVDEEAFGVGERVARGAEGDDVGQRANGVGRRGGATEEGTENEEEEREEETGHGLIYIGSRARGGRVVGARRAMGRDGGEGRPAVG